MPRATVDLSETTRFELKTAPPDGYVELRKLSYGEYLERRDMAAKMTAEGEAGAKIEEVSVTMMQKKVAAFELRRCVVSHNLTDNEDQPLNFQRNDLLNVLDPKIGQEIGAFIDDMNQFEADLKE